jgi:hypothetical protein
LKEELMEITIQEIIANPNEQQDVLALVIPE